MKTNNLRIHFDFYKTSLFLNSREYSEQDLCCPATPPSLVVDSYRRAQDGKWAVLKVQECYHSNRPLKHIFHTQSQTEAFRHCILSNNSCIQLLQIQFANCLHLLAHTNSRPCAIPYQRLNSTESLRATKNPKPNHTVAFTNRAAWLETLFTRHLERIHILSTILGRYLAVI
jgi:hypothetical protein